MEIDKSNITNKRVADMLNYINDRESLNGYDRKHNAIYNLEEAYKIYQSDLIEIRKVNELRKIYKTADEVRKKFSCLDRYKELEDTQGVYQVAKIIYDYLKKEEEKNIPEIAKEILEKEELGYFDQYHAACQLVELYLDYNDSVYLSDFCNEYKISEQSLMSYVDIVRYFNSELYDKFLEKYRINREERKITTINKYETLVKGITEEKENFDKLEVFKNLPFYNEDNSREVLNDFNLKGATNVDKRLKIFFDSIDSSKTIKIMHYLYENSIINSNIVSITPKDIYETKYIINEMELTNEDKTAIIKYMKENKIPFIVKAFNEVRSRYLDGTLDNKKEKILKK